MATICIRNVRTNPCQWQNGKHECHCHPMERLGNRSVTFASGWNVRIVSAHLNTLRTDGRGKKLVRHTFTPIIKTTSVSTLPNMYDRQRSWV